MVRARAFGRRACTGAQIDTRLALRVGCAVQAVGNVISAPQYAVLSSWHAMTSYRFDSRHGHGGGPSMVRARAFGRRACTGAQIPGALRGVWECHRN